MGSCIAGGWYQTASSGSSGLVENETGGVWNQSTGVSPPPNAATSSPYSSIAGVSCSQDEACGLIGQFQATGSVYAPFVAGGAVPPSAPMGVTASPGNGSVAVRWTPSAAATSYSVYSATTPGGENYSGPVACNSSGFTTECSVTGLTNGSTYYFTVLALDGVSASAGSNEVQGMPVASSFGYVTVGSDGGAFTFGNVSFEGSEAGIAWNAPIVGVAATGASGYWEVGADGGIYPLGNATFYGSMGGRRLNAPIVGMAAPPNGHGYWEVGSDGGVFAFGDARYYGSEVGRQPSAPIVGIASTPSGGGYWEVAANGSIYSFGDAAYCGGEAGNHLNAPMVGMAATRSGNGYWLVGSDGGVFAFGDATYFGSEGGEHLAKPIVGIASTETGNGYWEVGADGGVFSFGGAPFEGSKGGDLLNAPIVAIASPAPSPV